jgi:hypothetical protein
MITEDDKDKEKKSKNKSEKNNGLNNLDHIIVLVGDIHKWN